MKTLKLISIILGIILLSSCNKQEVKPKTLIGTWTFSSVNTSGEFTISKIAGVEKVNNGYFTVEGVDYTIDTSVELIDGIHLTNSDVTLHIIDYQVDAKYETITSDELLFNKPGVSKQYNETVTCIKQ